MPAIKKAVFLDRDGTIMQDSGYLGDPADVEMFDYTFEVLKSLQNEYELFIVTNQSGVGKGLMSLADVNRVNDFIDSELRDKGVIIKHWYVCPHESSDNCGCKKPNPFFLHKAAETYGINLAESWVIGDHPHDIEFALNGGAQGLYVLTGHGAAHLSELPPNVPVFHNLVDAAARILGSTASVSNYCTIDEGAEFLREGGLVAFPTETVYGLGADVFNPEAVARIFELKGRPLFNPLIAHISGIEMLDRLTDHISDTAQKLIDEFWRVP